MDLRCSLFSTVLALSHCLILLPEFVKVPEIFTFVMVLGAVWNNNGGIFGLFSLLLHFSFGLSYLGSLVLQGRKSHRSRRAQRQRPRRPSTAMGASTLWTLQPHLASEVTAHRCQAPTTLSNLKSSSSKRRSSNRALTCELSFILINEFIPSTLLI